MFEIRTDSDVPIHRQISEGVRLAIGAGRLAPGDELPSVRAMAVKLRINPNTVARAYRELETLGVLETRRGRGSFVARGALEDSEQARNTVIDTRVEELVATARQAGMSDSAILETVRKRLDRKKVTK